MRQNLFHIKNVLFQNEKFANRNRCCCCCCSTFNLLNSSWVLMFNHFVFGFIWFFYISHLLFFPLSDCLWFVGVFFLVQLFTVHNHKCRTNEQTNWNENQNQNQKQKQTKKCCTSKTDKETVSFEAKLSGRNLTNWEGFTLILGFQVMWIAHTDSICYIPKEYYRHSHFFFFRNLSNFGNNKQLNCNHRLKCNRCLYVIAISFSYMFQQYFKLFAFHAKSKLRLLVFQSTFFNIHTILITFCINLFNRSIAWVMWMFVKRFFYLYSREMDCLRVSFFCLVLLLCHNHFIHYILSMLEE